MVRPQINISKLKRSTRFEEANTERQKVVFCVHRKQAIQTNVKNLTSCSSFNIKFLNFANCVGHLLKFHCFSWVRMPTTLYFKHPKPSPVYLNFVLTILASDQYFSVASQRFGQNCFAPLMVLHLLCAFVSDSLSGKGSWLNWYFWERRSSRNFFTASSSVLSLVRLRAISKAYTIKNDIIIEQEKNDKNPKTLLKWINDITKMTCVGEMDGPEGYVTSDITWSFILTDEWPLKLIDT